MLFRSVHHGEKTSKVTDKSVFCCTGKMFVNNLSSSYEESHNSELQSVLSREEHRLLINCVVSAYQQGASPLVQTQNRTPSQSKRMISPFWKRAGLAGK